MVVLSANVNRIHNERGEAIGFQGVITDNTEKDRLGEIILTEKQKLESILEFFENIDAIREFEKLMNFSVIAISNILESKSCLILLEEEGSKKLDIKGIRGLDKELLETDWMERGNSIEQYVMRNEEPVLVKNIEYDNRFFNASKSPYLGRSFIIVPLKYEGKIMGVINVMGKQSRFSEAAPFSEIDLKVLTIIAGKISSAIENIKIYSDLNVKNVTDPITNIYNYRLLSESLDREIKRYKRGANDFFLFMMDVDDFKSYNDVFGHLEGDELLKNLGIILKNQVRETDIVCRYAGDEFCVVLLGTNLENVINPANKIIKAVEQFPFKRTVTISIGIASYQQGMTKKELIDRADQALYEAKNKGKNQVVVYGDV